MIKKAILSLLICFTLSGAVFADLVMSLTTNTVSELAGTISWNRSDAPFGTASPGSLLFDGSTPTNSLATLTTEPILFENFPESALDQRITIVDFDTGSFIGEIETFTIGAGTSPPPPSVGPTSLTNIGSYTNGLAGGTVNYDLRVVAWPTDDAATRSVSFNLSTVPEPSAFLAVGLIAIIGGAGRYFRRRAA